VFWELERWSIDVCVCLCVCVCLSLSLSSLLLAGQPKLETWRTGWVFFSILWGKLSGYHPQEDLAKFGYRWQTIKNPAISGWPVCWNLLCKAGNFLPFFPLKSDNFEPFFHYNESFALAFSFVSGVGNFIENFQLKKNCCWGGDPWSLRSTSSYTMLPW
jgi:hypothetical protein